MKKRIYPEIQKFLVQFSTKPVQGHVLKRLNTLTGLITGMIHHKSCHVQKIGSGIARNINSLSKETAASRFLENKKTDYKVHYLPYLKAFILGFLSKNKITLDNSSKNKNIYLAIDGSKMGTHYTALMLSLVLYKRSIPIFWVVKEGEKGHFPSEMHVEVVREAIHYLRSFLGTEFGFILLGDGEFDSVDLQQLCQKELNIDYVLRTASNSLMYEDDNEFRPRNFYIANKSKTFFIPDIAFSASKFRNVNFLYWFDAKRNDDPLYLLTTLDNAPDIMCAYQKRFSIETLFKDFKSRGFNLHKTRLKKEVDIKNLILVAALAFCLLINLGINNEHNPLKIKVQRIDKKINSTFSFAQLLLSFFIEEDIVFTFF